MSHDLELKQKTSVVCELACINVGWAELGGGGVLVPTWLNEVTSLPEGETASAVGCPVQWTSARAHRRGTPPNDPQLRHCSE